MFNTVTLESLSARHGGGLALTYIHQRDAVRTGIAGIETPVDQWRIGPVSPAQHIAQHRPVSTASPHGSASGELLVVAEHAPVHILVARCFHITQREFMRLVAEPFWLTARCLAYCRGQTNSSRGNQASSLIRTITREKTSPAGQLNKVFGRLP